MVRGDRGRRGVQAHTVVLPQGELARLHHNTTAWTLHQGTVCNPERS